MSTLAVFTAPPEVPATSHVTVSEPSQSSPPFGEVTSNGPAEVVEVMVVVSSPSRPPPARAWPSVEGNLFR